MRVIFFSKAYFKYAGGRGISCELWKECDLPFAPFPGLILDDNLGVSDDFGETLKVELVSILTTKQRIEAIASLSVNCNSLSDARRTMDQLCSSLKEQGWTLIQREHQG